MLFNKEHNYLICIDSDGTVMDTMTSKHSIALGPSFISTFGIDKNKDEILNEWIRINCFSLMRGYNRFYTLDIILDYVLRFGYSYSGRDEYHNWVKNTDSLSIPSILEEIKKANNPYCLNKALEWARMSNEMIGNMNDAESFSEAIKSIHILSKEADLIGVSTANFKALTKEWTNERIINDFRLVASQEYGTKEVVIKKALDLGYDPKNVIMIGDSSGDLDAAKECKIWFYPIIPKHENESWLLFMNEVRNIFFKGLFNEEYQNKLIEKYKEFLS